VDLYDPQFGISFHIIKTLKTRPVKILMEAGRRLRAASCVCDGLSCYMEQPAAFGGFWKQSSGEPGGLRDYGSSLLEFGSFGRPAAFRNTGFRYSRLPLYPAVADSRLSLFPPSEDSLLFHNPAILYPQGSNHSPIHPQDNCRPAEGCRDAGYPPPPADTACIPCNFLCSTFCPTLH